MKRLALILLAAAFAASACNDTPRASAGKPKYLWFDAAANLERFAVRDSVDYYLDKACRAGFNRIVVDVRPVEGEALYRSDILPTFDSLGSVAVHHDRDYLQYFIDAAHRRGMKVTASVTVFAAGSPSRRQGPVYDDPETFEGRTCIEYTPQGMVDIRDQTDKVAAFLNPAMPENRDYALSFIGEVAERYDIDGMSLDYCRYPDMYGDFSDFSRRDFERHTGRSVESWPQDIFRFDDSGAVVPGPLYHDWWAYRAGVISSFIASAAETIHARRPDTEVSYWAASWINGLFGTAQNWASASFPLHKEPYTNEWCNTEYDSTGFAAHLDSFMLGSYLEKIYGPDDPESIEFAAARARRAIMGDCRLYGTIYAPLHKTNIADAVYVCLRDTEGLMVFDICQVIEFDLWDDIRSGILRAEPDIEPSLPAADTQAE
ncbi:MAG: family 10 glycosylhydrolase [Alistipes sp.]|nr:family 10 glycosylhydrolase [Alistipes sp.]